MPKVGSAKEQRERQCLGKTKLCRYMEKCRHYPNCIFAHSLKELRNPPKDWDITVGHYWEPGMPMPTPNVKTLIERYLRGQPQHTIPKWAKKLQDTWSAEENAPPPGIFEISDDEQGEEPNSTGSSLPSPSPSPSPKGSRDPTGSRRRLRSPSPRPSSSSPLQAEPKRRKRSHEPRWPLPPGRAPPPAPNPSGTVASPPGRAPPPAPNPSGTVASCVRAIIGWEPVSLGTPNIGIAHLSLEGTDLVIGLCGVEELTKQSDSHILSRMVAILCGGGRWTKGLRDHLHPGITLKDLSPYTTFQGSYNGVLPKLNQSYGETFDALFKAFTDIWRALNSYGASKPEPKLVFFARLGGTGPMHS